MTHSLVPRREARHLLPFASVVLGADLEHPDGVLQANVWDISSSGACLCFTEPPPEQLLGRSFQLRLHQPALEEFLLRSCRVIWIHSLHGAVFVGLELSQPLDLSAAFFRDLIQPAALLGSTPG